MPEAGEIALYPLFLKLAGRRVLVVGAGAVAERKIASLLLARADVVVVAPAATAEVRRWAQEGAIAWHERPFEADDARGAWLIVAATSDAGVQQRASAAADARKVFVLAVDDVANATAYSGAIVRKAPFTVAISSSGEAPALTRLLREIIEQILPGDDWVEDAKRLRAAWVKDETPPSERFGLLVRAFAARARGAPR